MSSILPVSELPSGRQLEIHQGPLRAVITEVGAGLRSFISHEQELLDTYEPDEMASDGRGQVLLPWPGRLDKGHYEFAGIHYQVPINELEAQNAIHGLTRWLNWAPVIHEANRLVMALMLHPQPGYPFALQLEESYTLTSAGLVVETKAHNIGTTPLPYGVGHHPYFSLNDGIVNSAILGIPARSYLPTNERFIPTLPAVSVEGTSFDFRQPRPIGELAMDVGYTDLISDSGWTHVTLSAATGRPSITVSLDEAIQFLQVYTGENIADPTRRRRGLAIEPYTCAPNTFNNGCGLRVLRPGEVFSSVWSVTVLIEAVS